MREAVALLMIYLGFQIPWTNSFLATVSILMSLSALLFLCLAVVDRMFVGKRMGFRIKIDQPPADNTDAADESQPRSEKINY